jgi:hypothetical protein
LVIYKDYAEMHSQQNIEFGRFCVVEVRLLLIYHPAFSWMELRKSVEQPELVWTLYGSGFEFVME